MKRLYSPTLYGIRGTDAWGSGDFGAPRGGRRHRGVDFVATEGCTVTAPCDCKVMRIGWCYSDDPKYRLVVLDAGELEIRLLYVEPTVQVGDVLRTGDPVGEAQNISLRYSRPGAEMVNHVHMEVRLMPGEAVLEGRGLKPDKHQWINPRLLLWGSV